jgi:NAD-dependent dihydropyrimidine dehydrogenase PreA subunit
MILHINASTWSRRRAVVEPSAYDVRSNGKRAAVETRPQPVVREEDCVGCRLCYNVCPVDQCIEMVELPPDEAKLHGASYRRSKLQVTEDWETMKAYRERWAFTFTNSLLNRLGNARGERSNGTADQGR